MRILLNFLFCRLLNWFVALRYQGYFTMVPSEILLLQETKIEEEALLLINNSKWKLNIDITVNARGTCGGLATLWSDEKFQLKNVYATQH